MILLKPPAKVPAAVDTEVGGRIKERRKRLGLTQSALANAIGVTFQQIQKYERGRNRVGSSRLLRIANALGTSPSLLFGDEDLVSSRKADDDTETAALTDFIFSSEGQELNLAFQQISSALVRKSVVSLLKAVALLDKASRSVAHVAPAT